MNFFDFLPISVDSFDYLDRHDELSSENPTQMESTLTALPTESSSSLATSKDHSDLTFLLSSFPIVSKLNTPKLEGQRRFRSSAGSSSSKDLLNASADLDRRQSSQPLFSINSPGSLSSKTHSDLNLHSQLPCPNPVPEDPTESYQDLDPPQILNPTVTASHNFERVGSPSLHPPTTSPRLTDQVYVNDPTFLPHELNADSAESSQSRREHPENASNSLDAPFVSATSLHLPTNISSLSLAPAVRPDPNHFSSYTIIGTQRPRTYGQVVLTHFSGDPAPQLRTMKIVPKKDFREQNLERELDVLKWLAEMAGDEEHSLKDGLNFLQRMMTSFHNESTVFIVLDYHPAPLTHPEIASRLRLQRPTGSTDSNPTLASSRSVAARLRAVRLLAAELVLGILFLHEHGIVHQDIQPANVMISSAGHAVIGEFRAATTLPLISHDDGDESPASNSSLSKDTAEPIMHMPIVRQPTDVVTSSYAAPELLQPTSDGMLTYDQRVDFWSLGVLLHDVATGCLPFEPMTTDDGSGCGTFQKLAIVKSVGGGWDMHVEDLVKQLLVHDYRGRLCGPAIKNHSFFDQLTGIWHDIALLKHAPLPNPPSSQKVDDVSRRPNDGVTVNERVGRDLDSNTVQGLAFETETRSLQEYIDGEDENTQESSERTMSSIALQKRRVPVHSLPTYPLVKSHNAASNQNVVPDYIIPWINDPHTKLCDDCVSSIRVTEADNNSYLEEKFCDSGLVIAEDIPPSHKFPSQLDVLDEEPYSPNSSRSSSISTPKSPYPLSESDKELLLAAENYRQLEALLSSGSYFTDPPRDQDHIVNKATDDDDGDNGGDDDDDKDVSWQQDHRSSNVSAISCGGIHSIAHLVVTNPSIGSRSPSPEEESPKHEDVTKWSFEDEITVAVLDAMNQQQRAPPPPPPHLDHEFGVIPSAARQEQSSLKRTGISIKRTFEKFRRKLGSQ